MKKLNELIAMKGTLAFGSMWATYLFFVYGFLPVLFPNKMDTLLYWSNTVQLWSLPLLMVGQNLLGQKSDKQNKETHDAVMEELAIVKEELALAKEERELLKSLIKGR